MKRITRLLPTTFVALFSLLAGFYFFFPRDAALAYLWRKGTVAAAQSGVAVDSAALSVEGFFPCRVVVRNLRVGMQITTVETRTAIITPCFAESIMKMTPTADIRLESLSLRLPLPGQPPLKLSSYSSLVGIRKPKLLLSGISTAGDLAITGDMTVDLDGLKVTEADLVVSGERASLLEFVQSVLPFQKDPSGAWTLKRKGGESK